MDILNSYQHRQQVGEFTKTALECSAYLAPTEFGLTRAELLDVAAQTGYQQGEVLDSLQDSTEPLEMNGDRHVPKHTGIWSQFHFCKEPDYRNFSAIEFICTALQQLVRSEGIGGAKLERAVAVERAVATGISQIDAQAAVTILVHDKHFTEKEGVIRFAPGRDHYPLPSEQRAQSARREPIGRAIDANKRAQIYAAVQDVISRRSDGRPSASEPFTAFVDLLTTLGYAEFRGWWTQMVSELRRSDPSLSPISTTVLAAALVEGALTFVVQYARKVGEGPMGSKTFQGSPTTWKIDDLVSSAASGNINAILDQRVRLRSDDLIRARQRLHAGRMLSDYPHGVPDLRPEEARDAVATAEQVVRRVIDWIARPRVGNGNSGAT